MLKNAMPFMKLKSTNALQTTVETILEIAGKNALSSPIALYVTVLAKSMPETPVKKLKPL